MNPITKYILVLDSKGEVIGTVSTPGPNGENFELQAQCQNYYSQLGISGYEEYPDGIKWLFQGNWYTSDEVNRMLKMIAFT